MFSLCVLAKKEKSNIPLPSEDVYNTETVKKVFQSAAVYYGEKKFLHFAGALQTIIESIEDTIRARSITEDQMEKDIASLMSPVIFMLDNKFHKKEHPSNVDILAFEEEILPQITKRRPGFLKDYEIFKTMMTVNDKPVPAPVIAEPVHVNGFAAVRPQMVQ
jgi:hypothetical protein